MELILSMDTERIRLIKLLLSEAVSNFYLHESHFIADCLREEACTARIAIHCDRLIQQAKNCLAAHPSNNSEEIQVRGNLEVFQEFDRVYQIDGTRIMKCTNSPSGNLIQSRPDLLLVTVKEAFELDDNVLVVEVKKIGTKKTLKKDKEKLTAFVMPQAAFDYQYRLGAHLFLGEQNWGIVWYQNCNNSLKLSLNVYSCEHLNGENEITLENSDYNISTIKNYFHDFVF